MQDETKAREESMMLRPDAGHSELVAAIERAGWEAVAAIAEDRGDSNVAAQARHRATFASAPPDGERVESIALDVAETITAHMRSPDMIWGLGRIDTELLDEMEGELRSITVAALTNAILALSPTPDAGEVRTYREGVDDAARVAGRSILELAREMGMSPDATESPCQWERRVRLAAIRKLGS